MYYIPFVETVVEEVVEGCVCSCEGVEVCW